MRRLWESRWEGEELADLRTPSRRAALSGGPPRGLLSLQWGHSGAMEGTQWGAAGTPGCHSGFQVPPHPSTGMPL